MATSSTIPATDEFRGKRILVTGGTKGAGKAIADRFSRGGGSVVITARSAPEAKAGNYLIEADASTSEGTTTVIREVLDPSRESISSFTMWGASPLRAAALSL
jgi:NAD(P)-dependent dehydrogenase (short-subunit alcohol dehydrogenase family)